MKRVLLLLAFLMTAALGLASYAAACVAAGHGVGANCDLPVSPDTSQHCFVGKDRDTPKISNGSGGYTYSLDTTAAIQPIYLEALAAPCTGKAVSAWVMSAGATPQADGTPNLIQVGYWQDCSWNPTTYYFQTWHNGNDTACLPQPYCRWHNTLLWPADGGSHLFTVRRTAGTNNFQSYIDGAAYFPAVTVASSYSRQIVMMEDTVQNVSNAPCNRARYRFGAYATGPNKANYLFPWSVTSGQYDPGLDFTNEHNVGLVNWFDGSDWAS